MHLCCVNSRISFLVGARGARCAAMNLLLGQARLAVWETVAGRLEAGR